MIEVDVRIKGDGRTVHADMLEWMSLSLWCSHPFNQKQWSPWETSKSLDIFMPLLMDHYSSSDANILVLFV